MPFAKQELAGREQTPIRGEASVSGFGGGRPDLLFTVRGKEIGARQLIGAFDRLIRGVAHEDILKRHGGSPPMRFNAT